MQEILDTALSRADTDAQTRFRAILCNADLREENPADRRDATKLIGTMLVAAAAPGAFDVAQLFLAGRASEIDRRFVVSHQAMEQNLAVLYRDADPRVGLPAAMAYADSVLALLNEPMADRDRSDLGVLTVGVHAQVGLWACHMHRAPLAHRYLATACDVASTISDTFVQARALGALSYCYSSAPRGRHGGNPRYALQLLNRALDLAKNADGFTRGWLATWRADQYATLGELSAARTDIEMAHAGLKANDSDTTSGFFARATYGYGMSGHLDSVRAVVHTLAGEDTQADRMFSRVQDGAANMRRRIASYGHEALARTTRRDSEAACLALAKSLTLATQESYEMGLKRAAGVRAAFEPRWADLDCVRRLDEQIRHVFAGYSESLSPPWNTSGSARQD